MSDARERQQLLKDADKLVRDAGIILEEAPVETELHAVAARMSGAGVRISNALRALRDSEGREVVAWMMRYEHGAEFYVHRPLRNPGDPEPVALIRRQGAESDTDRGDDSGPPDSRCPVCGAICGRCHGSITEPTDTDTGEEG